MGDLPMLQNRNRLATLGNVNSQKKKKALSLLLCVIRESPNSVAQHQCARGDLCVQGPQHPG